MHDHTSSDLGSVEAAHLLGIQAETLAVWQRKFGFPTSSSPGGERRRFKRVEVLALRDALAAEVSVALAIRRAQRQAAESFVG